MKLLVFIASLLVAAGCSLAKPAAPAPETARPIHELVGQAETWTIEEIHNVAAWRKAPEYWIVEAPVYFITEGLVPYDHRSGEGTQTGRITSGVWLNTSEAPVVVAGGEMEPFELAPGAIVAVGDSIVWPDADAPEGSCSVVCRDGYYACCNFNGCRCRSSREDDSDCTTGGKGAAECTHPVREQMDFEAPRAIDR